MWSQAPASTDGYHPEKIVLHVFIPAADCETTSLLHEDDGLTFAFRDGAYYRTTFSLRRSGSELTLNGSVSGNGFPEFARKSFELVFHGATPATIRANGKILKAYKGRFDLPNRGEDLQITVDLAIPQP
jgi:alpha-glucosidase